MGDKVFIDIRNMKTSWLIKKGDDKWVGPYLVTEVYPQACRVQLPDCIQIFPVFHNYLLCRKNPKDTRLPGQAAINKAESRYIWWRTLEREDGEVEPVEKWEFEKLFDYHDEDSLHYLMK